MVDRDVGSIVVMDGDAIAGIFTERDYMQSIALKGRTSKETEVREVMEWDVAKVSPKKPLERVHAPHDEAAVPPSPGR